MIKNIFILYFLMFFQYNLLAQVTLVREGILINNLETGTWYGDNIPRSTPTALIYRNNSITSVNSAGFMLQCGDEGPNSNNNNLDGAVITGNKFTWNGVNSPSIITHGVFTGYNKNLTVKYNHLENVPYGLLFKSGTDAGVSMTFTSGGCAYNICKNGKFAVRMKGINGVKVYNNTFYSGDNAAWCLVLITSNPDRAFPSPSSGTEIFNNVFYTTSLMPMISIESNSLTNFKCDYNVYWCEAREPIFAVDGVNMTWTAWRARGYDLHSKIINPNFIDLVNFVPSARLDFGKDLGIEWQTGLATTATWIVGTSPATANQNGTWQVGARLYQSKSVSEITVTSAAGSNTINTYKGTLQLSALVLPTDAENKSVNWSIVNGSDLATVNSSGLVTAIANGNITVRATAIDGSGTFGEIGIAISNQNILIQSITIVDDLPNNIISGIGTKLTLKTLINPSNATNQALNWSVANLTGQATIDNNGLLTPISQGSINVIVSANDGSMVSSQKEYAIVIPVAIQDMLNLGDLKIFPNPSQGKIQIQFNKVTPDGVIVEIISELGQILGKKRIFESHSEWSISQFSGNIFLIRITGQTGSVTKRITLVSGIK